MSRNSAKRARGANGLAPKYQMPDVLVIGDGIAGSSAALAARKKGASVMIVEKSEPNLPHGNTAFCGGALRRVSKEYPAKKYFADIMKVSEGEADPILTRITIRNSRVAKAWLSRIGIRWTTPASNPGRADSVIGKGPVLASVVRKAVKKANIPVLYRTRVLSMKVAADGVIKTTVRNDKRVQEIACKAVIIATGGFQGNRKMVTEYLGKGAERLVLRGYAGNTGDGHTIAARLGATLAGMDGYHGGIIHLGYRRYPKVAAKSGMRSVKRYEKAILVNRNGTRLTRAKTPQTKHMRSSVGSSRLRNPAVSLI
jgi:succinate dehydrogenase/fumarate reductase flavoprotein subunit